MITAAATRWSQTSNVNKLLCFQDTDKQLSDWLSDLTLVDQHLDLEVLMDGFF